MVVFGVRKVELLLELVKSLVRCYQRFGNRCADRCVYSSVDSIPYDAIVAVNLLDEGL